MKMVQVVSAVQPAEAVRKPARPKLWIVSRKFGASGQPWLWRQVVGLREFEKKVLCWEHVNSEVYPVNPGEMRVLAHDPAPYDGAGRWWFRLRNLPGRNFYASVGRERRQLTELLRQERPAVILCYFGDMAMRLLPVARTEGIPMVAYFHGDFQFLSNRWFRWSLKGCLRQFAAIVVVTEAERRWMQEAGVPSDRVSVIPCGAPTTTFGPGVGQTEGPPRFVMASRLVPDKGCDLSIRAFAKVLGEVPGAELHLYGDGPSRHGLEGLIRALGLQASVRLHGYVDEPRLAEVLPSYDVFIQHSLQKEGSPVSIVEAMSCGLPVVATPVGGIVDQVVDSQTGFLIRERDVAAMATAMLRLARDLELRRSFGRQGRARAVKFYNAESQTQRLERVLFDALDGRFTPQPR